MQSEYTWMRYECLLWCRQLCGCAYPWNNVWTVAQHCQFCVCKASDLSFAKAFNKSIYSLGRDHPEHGFVAGEEEGRELFKEQRRQNYPCGLYIDFMNHEALGQMPACSAVILAECDPCPSAAEQWGRSRFPRQIWFLEAVRVMCPVPGNRAGRLCRGGFACAWQTHI